MSKVAVIISPNYKDYAERFLSDCLKSLRAQTYQDFTLFLIDNETSESSFNFLKTMAPEAIIIRCQGNEGFAGGNNAALKQVLAADYDYAFLVNMDTVADSLCLEKLVAAINEEPKAGAIQARLMLYPKTQLVNSLGNETHFLGFGYTRGYRTSYQPTVITRSEIAYPSGAAVLLRVSALRKIGCFDEDFWMYNEDQDLGWRLWLAGYMCLAELTAVVYHKYEFNRSIKQYYFLDRNRIIVIVKNYDWLTLILILPAFLLMELGLVMFALANGFGKSKLRVWAYFLSVKHWRAILKKRRQIQQRRVTPERKIISLLTGNISYQEVDSWPLRVGNIILGTYWRLIRTLYGA